MRDRSSEARSGLKLCVVVVAALLVLAGLAAWYCRQWWRSASLPAKPRTIEDVVSALGVRVESRLRPVFDRAGATFPPPNLTVLALKQERRLELYVTLEDGSQRFILSYPILAASGVAGPKFREGDRQVPEGLYRIELLNPNSRYHLSLRVNYPNVADVEQARAEGRDLAGLGGDIMIHGGAESVGCLAIGDPAIEELFVLVAGTGLDKVRLMIAPRDFRRETEDALAGHAPSWVA
ncbi:MAG TPA: L,D-transpeptidase family protein, partial [Terrimicrobiaceae bacterium]|nr:L,D-transpeptidase family protein [Terrimicrobiaceae bacterium]